MLEDLSKDQLQAQAGGDTLRNCVTDLLGIAKNTKRSSTRLKDALQKHGLPRDSTPLLLFSSPLLLCPALPCSAHRVSPSQASSARSSC